VNTDAEGKYSASLPPGLWDVTIYSKENNDFRLYDKLEISGVGRVEKTFRMPGGRILGRVVDAENKPIANLRVGAGAAQSPMEGVARRGPLGGRSTGDGTFLIMGLEPGTYNVAANADKLGAGRVDNVQVPLDGDSQQVVLQIGVQEGVTVVSKVLDANTGKPVLNSWVRLHSKDPLGAVSFERRHNSDGLARIENVPAGNYMFSAGADGYSWARRDLEVKIGPAMQFEDALYAVGWLRWTFLDREGHPVGGVSCRLTPKAADSVEQVRDGVTHRDGTFTQTGLEPGDYTGTATFSDNSTLTETFTISAGKSTEKVTKRN
ncbi:MAG: carboxypeptidase-like regulatory domain-containing protein, partial [bacterium]